MNLPAPNVASPQNVKTKFETTDPGMDNTRETDNNLSTDYHPCDTSAEAEDPLIRELIGQWFTCF